MKKEIANRLVVRGVLPGDNLPTNVGKGCTILTEIENGKFIMEITAGSRRQIEEALVYLAREGIDTENYEINPSGGSPLRKEVEFY